MHDNWNEKTIEEKLDFLRDALATSATRQSVTGISAQIQELQGAISQLEIRLNALENRPAVGC
jgi:hypothetical protein